ncbi:MAG: DNA gyrase inhibitor YacG [Proteobacteria bacterium]|nr:DNA gyrase inhibitor YacG [Pseudomonadota bacterium]
MICPICHQLSKEPYVPFCSKKCQNIDLLKWVQGEYRIISDEDSPREEE